MRTRDPVITAWRRQLAASIHAGQQAQFRLDIFLGRLDGLPDLPEGAPELAAIRTRLFQLTRALRAVQKDLARLANQPSGGPGGPWK